MARSVTGAESQKLRHEVAKVQQDLRSVYRHLEYATKREEDKQVELAQKLARDALGVQQLQVGLTEVVGKVSRQEQLEIAVEQLQHQVDQGHRSRSHTPPQQVRPRRSRRTKRRPPSSETSPFPFPFPPAGPFPPTHGCQYQQPCPIHLQASPQPQTPCVRKLGLNEGFAFVGVAPFPWPKPFPGGGGLGTST